MGIQALEQPSIHEVVLDLGFVTFLDAFGLGSLVTIRNASDGHGKNLVLSNLPARITWLLALTDLLSHFTVATMPSDRDVGEPHSPVVDVAF